MRERTALKHLIRAVDGLLDYIDERQTCPTCPADFDRSHKAGCVTVKLLRAREDAGAALAPAEAEGISRAPKMENAMSEKHE
jgi:hypothetical protein